MALEELPAGSVLVEDSDVTCLESIADIAGVCCYLL